MSSETLTAIATFAGAAATAGAVWVAWRQLGRMASSAEESVKSNSISTLATVLSIEDSISQRLHQIDLASKDIQMNHSTWTDEQLRAAQRHLDGVTQNYLNAMDRLCTCFLRGQIPEEDYKQDYQEQLPRTIETYEKYFAGANRRYKNILDLREKWRS